MEDLPESSKDCVTVFSIEAAPGFTAYQAGRVTALFWSIMITTLFNFFNTHQLSICDVSTPVTVVVHLSLNNYLKEDGDQSGLA